MALIQRHNASMYKKFETDIWGIAFATKDRLGRLSRLFYHMWAIKRSNRRRRYEPFYYRLDIINPKPRRRKKKKNVFFALRLVKTYYMTLTYKQFRNLARRAAKLTGDFESNYCSFLEGRLLFILYRSSFFFNIFDLMDFMKGKHVLVNHILIDRYDYLVNPGDFITFYNENFNYFYYSFKLRLERRGFIFGKSPFMYISYKTFFILIERKPYLKDLPFPSKLNIYRPTFYI